MLLSLLLRCAQQVVTGICIGSSMCAQICMCAQSALVQALWMLALTHRVVFVFPGVCVRGPSPCMCVCMCSWLYSLVVEMHPCTICCCEWLCHVCVCVCVCLCVCVCICVCVCVCVCAYVCVRTRVFTRPSLTNATVDLHRLRCKRTSVSSSWSSNSNRRRWQSTSRSCKNSSNNSSSKTRLPRERVAPQSSRSSSRSSSQVRERRLLPLHPKSSPHPHPSSPPLLTPPPPPPPPRRPPKAQAGSQLRYLLSPSTPHVLLPQARQAGCLPPYPLSRPPKQRYYLV